MTFVDRARIHVAAGRGGHGGLSFRREAHVPRGGPDGGNGGRGGGVWLVADRQLTDLSRFRHAVHHTADTGGPGQARNRNGRAGDDLEVAVPPGTRVLRDGAPIATLAAPGDRVQVARGGQGGVGNRAFRSSVRRAPRETVPGEDGEEAWLDLELVLPVDVALVGLPNSGKSALLRALTGAAVQEGPYPHATTEPAFGPLEDARGELFLVADLPGVDAQGVPRRGSGLGQLERARVVLHCLAADDPEPADARLDRVRDGVAPFLGDGVREVVVATRSDLAPPPPEAAFATSAVSGEGVAALRDHVLGLLAR
ncbi:MAG: 50S ribosome-binding GTPase [Thermoleophilia bacterium]|jgi:GTP-binding protein|nr:50S ribosome-binding GTPase [Thermoleophilia bacterium]